MDRSVPKERDLKELYLDSCSGSERESGPNLEKVRACLLLGADKNWQCSYRGSGLQIAAKKNSMELLELLLSEPAANVNFRTLPELKTALDFACEAGHVNIVRRLCQHSPFQYYKRGLLFAIKNNRVGCVEELKLFERGRGLERGPERRVNLVTEAASRGFAEVLEVLLTFTTMVSNLNKLDNQGKTAMHHAVEEIDGVDGLGCVQLLSQDERVDINIKNSNGETPITLAMKMGKTQMVKILLDNPRVDLDTVDKEGKFLENIARENDMREVLDLMWRAGPARNNLQTRITECPVCLERFRGDIEVHQCGRGHVVCGVCRPGVRVIYQP